MLSKISLIISMVVCISILGCASTLFPKHFAEAREIGDRLVGANVKDLIKAFPDIKVDEIGTNLFRYYIKYRVPCSLEEELLAPSGVTNTCYMTIYLFSENNIIVRYSVERDSLY